MTRRKLRGYCNIFKTNKYNYLFKSVPDADTEREMTIDHQDNHHNRGYDITITKRSDIWTDN